MKVFFRKRYAAVLILALAAMLAVLGRTQYLSTQQVSEATARDMEESLETALLDFRHSLERELTSLCQEMQSRPNIPTGAEEIARRFSLWHQTAAHSALATEVFLWDSSSDGEPIAVAGTGSYRVSPWPATLAALPAQLRSLRTASLATAAAPHLSGFKLGQDLEFAWTIDEQRLILLHPMVAGTPENLHYVWLIIPLNREFLRQHLLPELAADQFGNRGGSYQVAIVLDGQNPDVLYSSQPGFGSTSSAAADASLSLFGPPSLVRGSSGPHASLAVFPATNDSDGPHLFIDPVVLSPPGASLKVIAQHRQGSLEASVAALRIRNLALNFGMLGILGVTLALVIFTSQRARRLAQMEMDFVASVSHELRTPLTAIILAARNLEDGVVRQDGLSRYGTAIKGQAAQLAELVDEILLFSETHSGRHVYKLEPVDVALGIHTTIENLGPLIESNGFAVEEQIDPDLPLVRADVAAFSQCLQNLISNSLKYGGEQRWVGVRAFRHENAGRKEVCVSVVDRGLGIDSGELKQIFEPFYRSPAIASEIHGNGLGLPLTKSMVEAMEGRLTVSSRPGDGSTFTIHLRPVHPN